MAFYLKNLNIFPSQWKHGPKEGERAQVCVAKASTPGPSTVIKSDSFD